MVGVQGERALSEVIGFLMIVALLTILFSMYILYVIPLQGRDAEIAHMDQVKEQFTGLKMDTDSLLVNKRLDLINQRTISLGTRPGSASGAFSIIPLESYTGSAGNLEISENGPNISFIIKGNGTRIDPVESHPGANYYDTIILAPSSSMLQVTPNNLTLLHKIADPSSGSDNITLALDCDTCPSEWGFTSHVVPNYRYNESDPTIPLVSYDLAITINKDRTSHNTSISDLVVVKNVTNGLFYSINLMDWGYGLIDSLPKEYNLTYTITDSFGSSSNPPPIGPYGQMVYSPIPQYSLISGEFTTSHNLSYIRYSGNNRYWVQQDFLYQWGAVFTEQDEGYAALLTPPILISKEGSTILVNITDIEIQGSESISGNQDVPIFSRLTELDSTFDNGYSLTESSVNSNYVWIRVETLDDEYKKWLKVFRMIEHYSDINSNVVQDIAVYYSEGENAANLVIMSGIESSYPTESEVSKAQISAALVNAEENISCHYLHANLGLQLKSLIE